MARQVIEWPIEKGTYLELKTAIRLISDFTFPTGKFNYLMFIHFHVEGKNYASLGYLSDNSLK